MFDGDECCGQLVGDQRMVFAEPDESEDAVGFGVGDSCADDQLALWCEVALGDVAVDGMELDQVSNGFGAEAFGFGEEFNGFQAGGSDIADRAPPTLSPARCFRQSHTDNGTQEV